MTDRRKPGPAARFDSETRRRRRSEQNTRSTLIARRISDYVAEHHPKIFQKAKEEAETAVLATRPPLPGD
jgi:3-deoxy-D-arabino-heptulosonate 7-phosphate (DAHP) synthase class II